MVAFAIQNHGFSMVDLPFGGAQKINVYPRLCEMTQLWFVIFTDRRVIDMVSHVGRDGQKHFYSSKPPLLTTIMAAPYWVA